MVVVAVVVVVVVVVVVPSGSPSRDGDVTVYFFDIKLTN